MYMYCVIVIIIDNENIYVLMVTLIAASPFMKIYNNYSDVDA